ncbi:MAG: DUF5788 family protein [Euryarchaeota archaeon]|nr:DUF5788 family protein [Euryarchaeota archaeon]
MNSKDVSEGAEVTVWGVHLSDAHSLTQKERDELIFKLNRLFTFVGTEIPEEVELDHERVPLHQVMWQLINHKEKLTPEEFVAVEKLYDSIERKIRQIESTIKTGAIDDSDAITLFVEAQGLIRAAIELRDIEEGKQLDTYGELASAKKIEAQKRWLEYLKKVR